MQLNTIDEKSEIESNRGARKPIESPKPALKLRSKDHQKTEKKVYFSTKESKRESIKDTLNYIKESLGKYNFLL